MSVSDQLPQQPQAMGTSDGMVWIAGATFIMGSEHHYPAEAPARPVTIGGFWIDTRPVTNAEFGRFAGKTGYVTVAEQAPRPQHLTLYLRNRGRRHAPAECLPAK